jgi:hypothetical protein
VRYWEATLRVLRSYPQQAVAVGSRVTVRYISYADVAGSVNGPCWPFFERGQTALFALSPGERGLWRLVADEGLNLTVPAIAEQPDELRVTRGGRAFVLDELANALANGKAASQYAAAEYLRTGQWPDGLTEVLEHAAGTSDDSWLEIACALLASLGVPHPTATELLTNPEVPAKQNPQRSALQGAAWALAKGAKRDYPNRLIRCLLRNMSGYEWGAANALLEFKDSALVLSGMDSSLSRDPAGSIYAAVVLIRHGQHAFLRAALDAASKLVSTPEAVSMDRLQASSWLLREYGSDREFDAIPATLRRLKHTNEDAYRKLFGSVDSRESRRELRVAAVLIDDHRPGFGTLRYCDVAAADVQAISGRDFGIKQEMTPEERDRAVARAATWLRSRLQGRRN